MNIQRIAVTLLALALTAPAWAGNKSHTSSIVQNKAAQSWTQKCSLKKTGVSALDSYSGTYWVRYNGGGLEYEFIRSQWSVGPGATTFSETSVGLYSITAKYTPNTATSGSISVTFSATRYGPLDAKVNDYGIVVGYGGTFTCMGNIFVGSQPGVGALIHNILLEEHVGDWQ